MSSSTVIQSHINDVVSRSDSSNTTANTLDQANFLNNHHLHQSSHLHSIQSQSTTNSTSSVCTCSHHFHHIPHHHSSSGCGGSNDSSHHQQQQQQHHQHQHFHHQFPQASFKKSSHEDNERQISGETHVAVTVHQQQPQSHQHQALDSPSGGGDDSCDCNQSGQELSGRSSRLVSGDEATPSGSEDNNIRKCPHRANK